MARAGSINYQVAKIIKAHNGIGKSKLESRENSGLLSENGHKVSHDFHSFKSLDNARRDLTNLAKFAKENHQIKDMKKIDLSVIKSWINSKNISYNTASNYLSEINKIHEHLTLTKEEVKNLRIELKKELINPQKTTRSYKNLDKIQTNLNERSLISFQLQKDYGLRAKEATHINLKNLSNNTLSYKQKGGKLSQKEISSTLASKIRENAIEGKYTLNYRTYTRDLQKAVKASNEKWNGTHGIRHSYAQNQLEAGKTKQEVSEAMGHKREEITNTYLR